jgi:hypothetical protein
MISNLESHPALHQVPDCQTLSYLCYQVGEQFKRIILGLSDNPKSIATGSLVVQFERFKRDAIRSIPILKMKGVGTALLVDQGNGFELGVIQAIKTP